MLKEWWDSFCYTPFVIPTVRIRFVFGYSYYNISPWFRRKSHVVMGLWWWVWVKSTGSTWLLVYMQVVWSIGYWLFSWTIIFLAAPQMTKADLFKEALLTFKQEKGLEMVTLTLLVLLFSWPLCSVRWVSHNNGKNNNEKDNWNI